MLPSGAGRPDRRAAPAGRGDRGPRDRLPDAWPTSDDADWVDLAWGDKTDGGTARISVEVKNEPGALGVIATIIGAQKANIVNMRLDNRDTGFHTNTIDVEVHDLHHLTRLIAALRAADAVSMVERV